jgi:hypothetical protein
VKRNINSEGFMKIELGFHAKTYTLTLLLSCTIPGFSQNNSGPIKGKIINMNSIKINNFKLRNTNKCKSTI